MTAYNELGQVAHVENAASNRTGYAYDELGRVASVASPLSNTVHRTYDTLGNVAAEWGAAYPVAYEYDTVGRLAALYTYRGTNNVTERPDSGFLASSFDKTVWLYDQPTGLLTNKVFADGSRIRYTYTDGGILATRVWARGVTTAYSYDALGQLTNVNYSGSTPDVSYTRDRLGRVTSAASAASASLYVYTGLALVSETQDGVAMVRCRDTLGRDAGYGIGDGVSVAYAYDSFGRFASVVSDCFGVTNTFAYGRLPGTERVASVTNSAGFWRWVAYEQDRDIIASVENGFGSGTVSSFEYGNDAEGMRVLRVDSGAATNTFRRNVRGELTGAEMGAVPYGAEYDSIGNRIWSAVGSETNQYAANSLNQYTQVSGGMSVFPVYDADGNMLRDRTHWHTWDAENRLIRSEPLGTVTNGAVMVEYSHNHRNLRVAKIKKQLSGRGAGYPLDPSQAGTWDTVETRRYVWDGYNIAAETIIDHVTPSTNISYYTWGLDLSGTLQDAGGVGGLLAETKMTASNTDTYYAFGDANGNVTEYADAAGSVRGHYGYSPFGEMTAQSGDMADNFTHRFSTKPFDVETGIVMYEIRPYEPGLGRWLCRDPISETGGLNIYAMTGNNPVDAIDQYGMGEWSFRVNKKPYWEGHGVSVNVSYSLDETERKCCQKTMIKRWVKSMFGIMGGKYGDFWFDADIEDVLAGAGHFVAIAPDDNPEGPNILGYRVRWTQLFRFEAVCIKGPYAGKVLSTSEREYRTEGHWAGKDFKGYFLQ